jgi:hypothetical protein
VAVKLRPAVSYREFPVGAARDPSMRESVSAAPWEHQAELLA